MVQLHFRDIDLQRSNSDLRQSPYKKRKFKKKWQHKIATEILLTQKVLKLFANGWRFRQRCMSFNANFEHQMSVFCSLSLAAYWEVLYLPVLHRLMLYFAGVPLRCNTWQRACSLETHPTWDSLPESPPRAPSGPTPDLCL